MVRIALTLAAAVLVVAPAAVRAQGAPGGESPVSTRVIGLSVTLDLPVRRCTVPSLTLALAKHLRVPAGAEQLPGPCDWGAPIAITDRIPLIGLTFAEALELLIKADSRYYAIETNGVVVVRPLEAWGNQKHFLNTTVERLELKDDNIGAAFGLALAPLRGNTGLSAQLMSTDPTKLTLSLGPVSIVEALDATVRAHGSARWLVSYCLPEYAADVANASVMTFDDRGIGAPVYHPRRQGPDGKPIQCPAF